ncbi:MAG: family 43 glycosylhydrolase [Verrucomicrobia bacterium]|nr:family 43 glycosylhydrolase [Verrucomicrobiota bacterium]
MKTTPLLVSVLLLSSFLHGLSAADKPVKADIGVVPERAASKWVKVPNAPPAASSVKVLLPAARDVNTLGGLPLRKLLDIPLRDPQITRGGDGYYYMTGTEMDKNTLPTEVAPNNENVRGWDRNNGIPLWRSRDLVNWETMGYVWTFEKDSTWQKGVNDPKSGIFRRSIYAPEIHFIKGNYWIVYGLNYRTPGNGNSRSGLLRSTTGKPEGPYTDIKTDGTMPPAFDGSLFEDDDGKVYFLWEGYGIARMNDDMTALAESPRKVEIKGGKYQWAEGISVIKVNGKYILGNAGKPHHNDKTLPLTYDYYTSVSDSIYGPYEPVKRALPHCGHNYLFKDTGGNWWSTYFGSDDFAPFSIRPGLVAVEIDKAGHVSAKRSYPRPLWKYADDVKPAGNWKALDYDDSAWKEGEMAFGDAGIADYGPVTFPTTLGFGNRLFLRRSFDLETPVSNPALYLRYSGLSIRIWFNGNEVYAGNQPPNDYITVPLPKITLPAGRNVITVEAVNAAPNRYVDIGLIDPDAGSPGKP